MTYETVVLETIRQNVFATMYALIDANKPSNWNIFASYPEDEADFPCIILNSANIKPKIITMDSGGYTVEKITMEVEFFALSKYGDEQIEVGRDNVQNTMLTNQSTLNAYNLYLLEEPFDDSNVDTFIQGREKIRTAGSIISMGMK